MENTNTHHGNGPKLLDRVRDKIRLKHYNLRNEKSYCGLIKRVVLFHHKRNPNEIGATEDKVEVFLRHLAVEGRVSASTQNQTKARKIYKCRVIQR